MAQKLKCTCENTPHSILDKPGINLDEVQREFVLARGQILERLLDVVRLGLGVVTTTDLAKRATIRDLDAVPALEVFDVLEVGGLNTVFFSTTLSIPKLSSFATEFN